MTTLEPNWFEEQAFKSAEHLLSIPEELLSPAGKRLRIISEELLKDKKYRN